jgi:hypothetical protein
MNAPATTGAGAIPEPTRAAAHGVDWPYVLMAFVMLVIDTLLLAALYVVPTLAPLLLLLHVALCTAAGLWLYRRWLRGIDYALPLVLVTSTVFIGPIAPAILLLVHPYFLFARGRATPFDVWYSSLFPEEKRRLPERLYDSIIRHEVPGSQASSVVSFMDVVRHGAAHQKFAVISLIARAFRPAFTPVLKAALNDDANEVRVQAATAIAKLTDDYLKRLQKLEDRAAEAPNDLETLEQLARAYDDFSYAGILDPNHEHSTRSRALDLWLKVAEAKPDHPVAPMTVGRLLMRLERYDLAASWMERAIAENRASPQMLVWYMECLFRQGRLDELRLFAQARGDHIEGDRPISAKALSAVRLWRSGPDDAVTAHA